MAEQVNTQSPNALQIVKKGTVKINHNTIKTRHNLLSTKEKVLLIIDNDAIPVQITEISYNKPILYLECTRLNDGESILISLDLTTDNYILPWCIVSVEYMWDELI